MARNNLHRENRLKQQLEREFQVDCPPESYFQAVQSALDSLPDELPIKRRPLPQRMLRGFAACAACLVLLAAGAYGMNLAAPSLMESMPGIGQIFQELNHHEETTPEPTPTPDPLDPSQVESEQLPDVPEFQPVDVISQDNSAMFSVLNASCDGICLTLDIQLQVWDSAMAQCYQLSPCSDLTFLETDTSVLLVNNQQAQPLDPLVLDKSAGQPQDFTTFTASWTYRLPQEVSHGETLSFMLEAPMLYGIQEDSGQFQEFSSGFSVIFECYADLRNTFTYSEMVEDNGITLESVEVSSQAVVAQMTIPYFGTMESTLLTSVSTLMSDSHRIALGSYPVLTTQDGQQLDSNYFPLETTTERITSDISNTSQTQQGAFTFEPPPEGTTQLILTLYEYPSVYDGRQEITQKNRVTAEFTIDLERGTVYPSQNYVAQGQQKLDHTQSASMDRTPTRVNGYICGQPEDFSGDYVQIPLYTKDLSYRPDRPVSLQCYLGDDLWGTYSSVDEADFNATDGNESYYNDTIYSYYQQTLIDPEPTGNGPYQAMIFQIKNIPEGQSLGPDDIHFSLVDQDTGEVLVEDVVQAYYQAMDEVLGTNLELTSYLEPESSDQQNSSDTPSNPDGAEEQEAQEFIESSPEASPNPSWF